MDQLKNNNESTPFKLPEVKPAPEELNRPFESGANNIEEHSMSRAVEQNAISNPLVNSPPQSARTIAINPIMPVDNAAHSNQTSSGVGATSNLSAADTDLIEKAWVVKAKEIVEKTKNDPHEQTSELTKMKLDYQHKRFNTNIKIEKE